MHHGLATKNVQVGSAEPAAGSFLTGGPGVPSAMSKTVRASTEMRNSRQSTFRVALVVSRYNESVTGALRTGAERAFQDRVASKRANTPPFLNGLEVFEAAGAFETIAISNAAASSGRFRGVVALGCIIKGETTHDQHLASAVTTGLAEITIRTGIPVGLGVLTVNSVRQALDRAGGKHGNKGEEAMHALLDTVLIIDQINNSVGKTPRGLALAHAVGPRVTSVPDKGQASRRKTAR